MPWNGSQVFRTCKTTRESTIYVGCAERMSRLPGNNSVNNLGYKLIICGSLFEKEGMKKQRSTYTVAKFSPSVGLVRLLLRHLLRWAAIIPKNCLQLSHWHPKVYPEPINSSLRRRNSLKTFRGSKRFCNVVFHGEFCKFSSFVLHLVSKGQRIGLPMEIEVILDSLFNKPKVEEQGIKKLIQLSYVKGFF